MSDDTPLIALTAQKFDDDIPLSALAVPQKTPKAGAKSGKAKAPGAKAGATAKKAPAEAAAKAKAKAGTAPAPKKPDGSSSSSSSESSDDSSSDGKKASRPKKATKAQKFRSLAALKKKRSVSNADMDAEEEEVEDTADYKVTKRARSAKAEVVAELLSRWWYALPDWPPSDPEYYKARLEEKQLREVTIQEWEWVSEKDSRGFRKVYQLSQFKGCYRDSEENLIDIRPKETCPCLRNFMGKDMVELYTLLVKAYEEQLVQLAKSNYNEEKLKKEIQVKLTKHRNSLRQAESLAGKKGQ
mmetsp:Transcript_10382/g.18502  ORF Transcript_10382/g.18502 Transcript_10382/m.18502 type:complete len:299 (-) Transcript_10382:65-961(-)|eukprot:CAMPEP_0197662494 /NCGR_PEP_ID=MMETSP1338-20131121/53650_1 /TAXON_ID=43686 ORGANISM="Pelagodinium beii, Strain RCC1491" /NCGR_SAMPLE_ID=MMETSP1338 /ASSEMBLY_ACC=CAM_ASM_000754 /LENGTH=298 /DNA_ID=CAMNT_0043240379 /DNA_START=71 /DNA_END=967 /DNA_ORIENTATION=+